MTFKFDIEQFIWNKNRNTFFVDAWHLLPMNEGYNGNMDIEITKEQFYIHNFKTGGFRRFTFLKEVDDGAEWLFISGDGILCQICVVNSIYPYETY